MAPSKVKDYYPGCDVGSASVDAFRSSLSAALFDAGGEEAYRSAITGLMNACRKPKSDADGVKFKVLLHALVCYDLKSATVSGGCSFEDTPFQKAVCQWLYDSKMSNSKSSREVLSDAEDPVWTPASTRRRDPSSQKQHSTTSVSVKKAGIRMADVVVRLKLAYHQDSSKLYSEGLAGIVAVKVHAADVEVPVRSSSDVSALTSTPVPLPSLPSVDREKRTRMGTAQSICYLISSYELCGNTVGIAVILQRFTRLLMIDDNTVGMEVGSDVPTSPLTVEQVLMDPTLSDQFAHNFVAGWSFGLDPDEDTLVLDNAAVQVFSATVRACFESVGELPLDAPLVKPIHLRQPLIAQTKPLAIAEAKDRKVLAGIARPNTIGRELVNPRRAKRKREAADAQSRGAKTDKSDDTTTPRRSRRHPPRPPPKKTAPNRAGTAANDGKHAGGSSGTSTKRNAAITTIMDSEGQNPEMETLPAYQAIVSSVNTEEAGASPLDLERWRIDVSLAAADRPNSNSDSSPSDPCFVDHQLGNGEADQKDYCPTEALDLQDDDDGISFSQLVYLLSRRGLRIMPMSTADIDKAISLILTR